MDKHAEFVQLATELLTEEGCLVTLQVLGSNTSDPSKPWKGVDYEDIAMQYLSVPCVYVAPIGKDLGIITVDKDLLKRTKKVALCAAVAEGIGDKIARIKDTDGTIWKVVWSQTLSPAGQTILYIFGIAQ